MKVRVDATRCQGHARCAAVGPAVYQLDEWGHCLIEEETVPEALEDDVRRGAAACPEHAITIENA
jgi:ferredoxin